MGCCGYVAREEIGEGEGVAALFVFCWFSEELPFEEFSILMFAVRAVFIDWLFKCNPRHEDHLETSEFDLWISDCKKELA